MSEPRKQYREVVFMEGENRPYSALLRGVSDQGVAVLELVYGARDGEIVRDVPHDPTGSKRMTWHERSPARADL